MKKNSCITRDRERYVEREKESNSYNLVEKDREKEQKRNRDRITQPSRCSKEEACRYTYKHEWRTGFMIASATIFAFIYACVCVCLWFVKGGLFISLCVSLYTHIFMSVVCVCMLR